MRLRDGLLLIVPLFAACGGNESVDPPSAEVVVQRPINPTEERQRARWELARLDATIVDDKQENARYVVLRGKHVTDEKLQALSALPEVKALGLNETGITDEGLVHVSTLSNLAYLFLDGTDITDAGLKHLRNLDRLRYISMKETRVTPRGIAELAQFSPGIDVDHSRRNYRSESDSLEEKDGVYRYRGASHYYRDALGAEHYAIGREGL